jgi:hypothetical protein
MHAKRNRLTARLEALSCKLESLSFEAISLSSLLQKHVAKVVVEEERKQTG